MTLEEESIAELKSYLDTSQADYGLNDRGRQLVSFLCQEDDEAFKIFSSVILTEKACATVNHQAARSYRAMNVLKEDMASAPFPSVIIKTNAQAGLLAKDLITALASVKHEYTLVHIRELLEALLERFPERVLAAAASGGKQGVQDHLVPLFISPATLSVLTNLVCYGATGRQGQASAEKSSAHTTMYQHHLEASKTISAGARKKFVRQMIEFDLLDRLATTLKTDGAAGEEVCESMLTILEVVGYPPAVDTTNAITTAPQVGEDVMLAPLASGKWWKDLLEHLQQDSMDQYKKESIARTLHSTFALATGNSSRIVKSHAPATDATEQTSESIVEEKEETITNRLVEWGLTDGMHSALIEQLPVLLKSLQLPYSDILNYQATILAGPFEESKDQGVVRHPGRYRTVPIGSWRLQLFSLLKEIVCYKGKDDATNKAMDAIMELPLAPELLKAKKKKNSVEAEEATKTEENNEVPIYNPWPALCSFVFAYPYNDFYHNIFYQMLQAVVLEHHEPTLRVIFQKSKFLTRALRSLTENSHEKGLILRVLNLLRLRSQSLPPNSFLTQYLGSHDLWKEVSDQLMSLTMNQETPIKSLGSTNVDLDLGSSFASKLGLAGFSQFDASTAVDAEEDSADQSSESPAKNSKKKKSNKKKKKKK